MRKISDEEIEYMRTRWSEGADREQIGNEMSIKFGRKPGEGTFSKYLRGRKRGEELLVDEEEMEEVEVIIPKGVKRISDKDKKDIVKRLNKKEPVRKIAEDFPIDNVMAVVELYEEAMEPLYTKIYNFLKEKDCLPPNSKDPVFDGIREVVEHNEDLMKDLELGLLIKKIKKS